METQQIISLVIDVAKEELLHRFARVKETHKADGSLITEADLAVQQKISAGLKRIDNTILFLAEEMSREQQSALLKQKQQAIWVLDPLDGTTNFTAGIPYYAISLALIVNGEVTLGIVYDPERDECFVAEQGKVATLNNVEIKTGQSNILLKNAVACVDLKRLPAELGCRIVTEHPFRSQRSFGGVALDWCWLALGRFDIYLHGKQNIWDYAAGHFIFSRAGGTSSTLDGQPVFSHDLSPRVGVGAVNEALFTEWANWLGIS